MAELESISTTFSSSTFSQSLRSHDDSNVWHVAAKRGDDEILRLLHRLYAAGKLGSSPDTSTRDSSGRCARTSPTKAGTSKAIQGPSAPFRMPDCLGRTPLLLACAFGHHECVQTLLYWGCDPAMERDKRGRLPLHLAAHSGFHSVVDLLLKWGRCGSAVPASSTAPSPPPNAENAGDPATFSVPTLPPSMLPSLGRTVSRSHQSSYSLRQSPRAEAGDPSSRPISDDGTYLTAASAITPNADNSFERVVPDSNSVSFPAISTRSPSLLESHRRDECTSAATVGPSQAAHPSLPAIARAQPTINQENQKRNPDVVDVAGGFGFSCTSGGAGFIAHLRSLPSTSAPPLGRDGRPDLER